MTTTFVLNVNDVSDDANVKKYNLNFPGSKTVSEVRLTVHYKLVVVGEVAMNDTRGTTIRAMFLYPSKRVELVINLNSGGVQLH